MAKGKKTGGRDFKKGEGGRQKGAKDKVPRGFKRSIRALYEQLADEQPETFRKALEDGLKAKAPASFQYLQMGAHYLDGKPAETVTIRPDLTGLSTEEVQVLERLLSKTQPSS